MGKTKNQPRGRHTPVSDETGLHAPSGEAVEDSNKAVDGVKKLTRSNEDPEVRITGVSQEGSKQTRATKNGAQGFLQQHGMSATAQQHETDLELILNTQRTGAKPANAIVEKIYAKYEDTDVRAFCAPSLAGGTFVSAAAEKKGNQPELRQRWVLSFLGWCAKRDASSQSDAPVQFGDRVAESTKVVKPVGIRRMGSEPAEGKAEQGNPAEDEPAEGKAEQGKPAKDEPAEGKAEQGKPAKDEPAEGKAEQGNPAKDEPAEGKREEDKSSEDEDDEDKTEEGESRNSRNSHLTPEERRLRAQKKKEHQNNSAMHRVRFPFDKEVSSSSKELSVFSLQLNDKRKMSIVTYAILYVLLQMGGGYLMLSDRDNEKGNHTPCLKTVKNDQDQESQEPKVEPDDKEQVDGKYHMHLVLRNNVDYVVMYQSFYRVHNDKVAKDVIQTVLADHCKERLQLFDKSHLICHVCTVVNSKVVKKVEVSKKVFKRLPNNFCCSQHSGTVSFPVKFKDEEGNPKVFNLNFCSHYIHLLCSEVDSRVNRLKSADSKKQPRFVQTYNLDTAKVDKIQELLNEVLLDSEGKPKYSPIDFLYFSDPNDTSMLIEEDMDIIPPKMQLENCEVRVPVFSEDDDENVLITNLLRTNFWNMSNSLLKSTAPNNRGGLNKHFLGDAYKSKSEPKAKRAKSEDVQMKDMQKILETLKKNPEVYQRLMSELSAKNVDTNIPSGSADLTSATMSVSPVPASSTGRKKAKAVMSAERSEELKKLEMQAEQPAEEKPEEQAEENAEEKTKKRKIPRSSEQCKTENQDKGRSSDTESDDDKPVGKSSDKAVDKPSDKPSGKGGDKPSSKRKPAGNASGKRGGRSSAKPVGELPVAAEKQVNELFGNMFKNKK